MARVQRGQAVEQVGAIRQPMTDVPERLPTSTENLLDGVVDRLLRGRVDAVAARKIVLGGRPDAARLNAPQIGHTHEALLQVRQHLLFASQFLPEILFRYER